MRAIYSELAPVVVGYLRAKGAAEPEALTGDVFVTVLQRLGGLTGGASGLRTFVMSVAHARSVDEIRRRQRQPTVIEYTPETDTRVSNSAERSALNQMEMDRMMALLCRLPESQREVLLLRIVADLAIETVAEIVGKSPGAVKRLQRRGLLGLRRMLDEDA